MPTILTPSMFAYLIWENKDGKEMRAMFEVKNAIKIAEKMQAVGVDSKFVISLVK